MLLKFINCTYLQKQYFSAEYLASNRYIASNCELLSDKSIECHIHGPFERLLSMPVLAAGYTSVGTHVIADVKLGINPKYGNQRDSDFYILLSDGTDATGFLVPDRSNYRNLEPCSHIEGKPGKSLANRKNYYNGPRINSNNPVPQEFGFFFSTKQKWGSCVTATAYEGSYTTSGHYTAELHANNGLYLDIYSDNDRGEVYNFKYIIVDIQVDY